jgi:DNA invertase Pin-like site-specific DNA recombinase
MNAGFASKRVAIYARYSSSLQNERSIEDQVRRCAEHVRAAGGSVDEDLIFTDMAISAASLKRPGFEMMMKAVDEHRVDAIVAEDVSRISRDLADSAALFKRLQYAGVPLIGVADGIDTGSKSAKLTFTVKSLVADLYLDDLRDKTRRGLEGRCRAGYSTGGMPFGYRTEAALTPDGRELGRRIVVDEDAAKIVRRVFDLYLAGNSYDAIAKLFNAEQVPYARQKTKHRRKGWVSSTVRAMIHNSAYVGEWAYNRREWRKLPGTNIRRPRKRDASEVIVQNFPERRIVAPEIWDIVRKRATAVSAKYKGKRGGVVAPGGRTQYPLSGLLFCGSCGAAMIIARGTSATYYSCGDARKRGTCDNRAALREDAARTAILRAVRDSLFTPAALAFLRKRIAERLRDVAQTGAAEIKERVERLRRTEERIRGLVKFVAEGDHSQYVRETLRDLEAQALAERSAIDELTRTQKVPVKLPTPDALLDRARDLERVLAADPLRAREALREVFADGKIVVHPQSDGSYVAEATFLPLAAVAGTTPKLVRRAASKATGLRALEDAVSVQMKVTVPKPPDGRFKRNAT